MWHKLGMTCFHLIRGARICAMLALIGVMTPTPGSAQQAIPAAPLPDIMDSDRTPADFDAWLNQFKATLVAEGMAPNVVESLLTDVHYSPRVVALDRQQPDDSRTQGIAPQFATYLPTRLNDARIAQGRRLYADLSATLSGIEARYGVPGPILMGIWGMESSYGNHAGRIDILRSLASLAYDGRRRALFTRELRAAVRILAEGRATRAQLVGSWAGATGQPQFLPSSYLAYAVDHDGDGRADIWSSRADTLASIGHYLSRHGWNRGQGWGLPVTVPWQMERWRVRDLVQPEKCPRVLARHSRWITMDEWRKLGVRPQGGAAWPTDGQTLATLVEPDGPGKGAYLTYGNYRALLEYNCSNFYALSVALLADAIAGASGSGVDGGLRAVAPHGEAAADNAASAVGAGR